MKPGSALQWQKRVRECPTVFAVVSAHGEIGNLYESREAAQYEVDFWSRRPRPPHIIELPIYSVALSRERWDR